ncbi:MAG: 3'-5' exonuclease [Burkholderiaceae bacterium]
MLDNVSDPADLSKLAALLDRHPDYRVLQRLPDTWPVCPVDDPVKVVILDTETTGTDCHSDAVIEIGGLAVEADATTGQIGSVLSTYSALEDPGFSIPPSSTAIHGITDDMVKGKRFDDSGLQELLDGAALLIAHNAAFDRPFLEKRFECFKRLSWGCSFKQIDWQAEGYGSAKLEFILYKLGYFYEAHRAVTDCHALLKVLAEPLPTSGVPAMQRVLDAARQKEFVIHALNAAFETKDLLKEKGFRWDANSRVWKVTVSGKLSGDEMIAWMKKFVYYGAPTVTLGFEVVHPRDRFSLRSGTYATKLV